MLKINHNDYIELIHNSYYILNYVLSNNILILGINEDNFTYKIKNNNIIPDFTNIYKCKMDKLSKNIHIIIDNYINMNLPVDFYLLLYIITNNINEKYKIKEIISQDFGFDNDELIKEIHRVRIDYNKNKIQFLSKIVSYQLLYILTFNNFLNKGLKRYKELYNKIINDSFNEYLNDIDINLIYSTNEMIKILEVY